MHLIVDGSGDHHATGLGELLQPRRDVDPVAKDVGTVHHHIAQIDADAKPHLVRMGRVRILTGRFLLNLDRTLHGLDDAGELGDDGIAPGVDDAPIMARPAPATTPSASSRKRGRSPASARSGWCPALPVEAFIQTSARTVLSYLVKPLHDQALRAFREK